MKNLKTLHISETFVGGVYTYIKQLCAFSENENFENFIIYSNQREKVQDERLKIDFSKNTFFKEVGMSREISPIKDLISFISIVKEIRKIKPDIIHVHSSKAGVLGRIARVFHPKAKLFYTPHGYSFIREDISESKKQLFRIIENTITKLFGGLIVACGDQEFEEAKKTGKAILVRNGVFINEILKFKKEIKNKKLKIGTCGSIYSPKNPELFNQIAEKLPEYQFIWIGDGELRNKLNASNITVTGWNTREKTLIKVNELDVFLSTSLWEGLPFSIIEALTLSKPIISSKIEGNKVTINQNKNGYICNNIEEFVQKIKILEDESIRIKFGSESFKISEELFNIEKNFLKLIDLYKFY